MAERVFLRRSVLVPCLLAAAAAVALLRPLRPAFGVTVEEARWLLTAPGLGPALADTWAGAIADDRLLRLPILLIAVVLVMLSALVARRRSLMTDPAMMAALLTGLATAGQAALLLGPLRIGSFAPLAGVGAGATMILLPPRSRVAGILHLALAAALAPIDPGLAVLPLGVGLGGILGAFFETADRSRDRSRLADEDTVAPVDRTLAATRVEREVEHAASESTHDKGDGSYTAAGATLAGAGHVRTAAGGPTRAAIGAARVACGVVLLLLLILLLLHPTMTWHERSASGAASALQKLFLVIGASAVCLGIMRVMRHSPWVHSEADRSATAGASGDRTRTPPEGAEFIPVRSFALLGAFIACTAWLLVPFLGGLSLAPLYSLLLITPALAALSLVEATSLAVAPLHGRVSWLSLTSLTSLAVVSLLATFSSRVPAAHPLPVGEALAAMRASDPTLRQVMAGPGLTRGILARRCRAHRLEPVAEAREERVGMIAVAFLKPLLAQRDALVSALGDRVVDRYGLVAGRGVSLKWSLLRPFGLRISQDGPRPNIALISVDTLRADHLGFYGYARATSPGLDRWTAGAVVYDRASSAAPATAPSFSSLLTGRLPIAHGVRKNYDFLDPGNWTLPMILRRAGYETAAFVSSFVLTSENSGLDVGLDRYDQHLEGREKNREERPVRLAPALSKAVVPWLERHKAEGPPWFLWVHAIDPHGPYTPLAPFRGAFQGGPSRTLTRSDIPDYQWLGTLDFATYVNAYDSEILQTDRYIREILETIERLPSPRGTILVFTADHGEAFGEHSFFFQHGQTLHSEEIRVPLVIKDSGRPRTGRVQAPVSLLDVVPTLLARLGIGTDLPLDGETLDTRESSPPGHSVVVATWQPGEVMACSDRWKLLIGDRRGSDPRGARFYDVVEDPGEMRPLPLPERRTEEASRRTAARPQFQSGHPRTAPPSTEASAAADSLMRVAREVLGRDPLGGSVERALDRQQWETLQPDAKEKLRALGYLGP